MSDIILSTQNGEPVVSSRQIAENFGKDHAHVLRDIDNLLTGESKNGLSSMFFRSEYTTSQNKKLPSDHISINRTPKVTGKGQVYFVNVLLKCENRDKAGDDS